MDHAPQVEDEAVVSVRDVADAIENAEAHADQAICSSITTRPPSSATSRRTPSTIAASSRTSSHMPKAAPTARRDSSSSCRRTNWRSRPIGRAQVRTPVTNTHLVCRLLHAKISVQYQTYHDHPSTEHSLLAIMF